MLLAIDVGNTNTVLGLFRGDELTESFRIKTDPRSTADEMMLTMRGLLSSAPRIPSSSRPVHSSLSCPHRRPG